MYRKIAKQAIKRMAKNKGVSEKTIIRQMDDCIEEAMGNPDPLVQMHWQTMFGAGKKPTAIDFLAYMAEHPVHEIL